MVQGSQLFKRFRKLKRCRRPVDKVLEEIGSVTIEPDVSEWLHGVCCSWKGNRRAGKVEGVVRLVEDDLYNIGVIELGGLSNG